MLVLENLIAKRLKSVLLVFAILGLAGHTTAEGVQYDQAKLAEIGNKLDQLYESGVIPNYVVDIRRAGQPVYFRARGNTELGGGVPVSDESIYVLASMSKPIVSTAVLKLIEDGKLGLDDPLAKYFPQFESMLVAPNGDLDAPFEEAKQAITIRHLLTHTSGFTYPPQVLGVGDVAQQYDDIGLLWGAASSSEEFADILSQIPLVAHPGETFNYSVSIDALGSIFGRFTVVLAARRSQRCVQRGVLVVIGPSLLNSAILFFFFLLPLFFFFFALLLIFTVFLLLFFGGVVVFGLFLLLEASRQLLRLLLLPLALPLWGLPASLRDSLGRPLGLLRATLFLPPRLPLRVLIRVLARRRVGAAAVRVESVDTRRRAHRQLGR